MEKVEFQVYIRQVSITPNLEDYFLIRIATNGVEYLIKLTRVPGNWFHRTSVEM